MTVEVVVTDLDGTLWPFGDETHSLHESTRTALEELRRKSVPVLAATSRRSHSAQTVMSKNGLDLPAVLMDGGLGRDPVDGPVFFEAPVSAEEGQELLRVFSSFGVEPVLEIDEPEVDVLVGSRSSSNPAYIASLGSRTRTVDLHRSFDGQRIFGLLLVGVDKGLLRRLQVAIHENSLGRAHLVFHPAFDTGTILVRSKQAGKWAGISAFCTRLGLSNEAVLAIGDGDNDVEMLERARVALAMSTGSTDAKSAADRIVGAPGEGGWKAVLDYV